LSGDHEGGGNSDKGKKGNKHDPRTASSFTDVHTAYKIVTTFFNVYCIGEQNIFDLELLQAKRTHPNLSVPVGLQVQNNGIKISDHENLKS